MGYTLSFDASVKVKMGGVTGYLQHVARDVDRANGVEIQHSNTAIHPERTSENVTMFYNEKTGTFQECKKTSEIVDALKHRLSFDRPYLKKDGTPKATNANVDPAERIVVRPLILQLDPDWYAEHDSAGERKKSLDDMLEWATGVFGAQNIVGYSAHNDETNPHLHLVFVPMTEDGHLSQKSFFQGSHSLQEMHVDFRKFMTEKGYDISMSNKKPGKYARRMSEDEYKDFAELQKKQAEIEAKEQALREAQEELERNRVLLMEKERKQEERDEKLTEKEERIDTKLQEWRGRLFKRHDDVIEAEVVRRTQEAVKGRTEALEARERDLDARENLLRTDETAAAKAFLNRRRQEDAEQKRREAMAAKLEHQEKQAAASRPVKKSGLPVHGTKPVVRDGSDIPDVGGTEQGGFDYSL